MQCPDTAKPPVGVSKKDRTERKKVENKSMEPNGEDGQKVSHINRRKRWERQKKEDRERRRTVCVLIEKRQRAGEKAKRRYFRIHQVFLPC